MIYSRIGAASVQFHQQLQSESDDPEKSVENPGEISNIPRRRQIVDDLLGHRPEGVHVRGVVQPLSYGDWDW